MSRPDVRLDERGKRCPIPVITLARAAGYADSGALIAVTCTDAGAASDIPAWCDMKRMEYVGSHVEPDGAVTYLVRKP